MDPNVKVPAPIKQIELRKATFVDTPATDSTVTDLTCVNFFFGNNGTGKSTVAQAIATDQGVSYNPGYDRTDYAFHIYDEDYIQRNFQSYQGMPGLFTMDNVNVEVQQQVEEKQQKIQQLREQREQVSETLEKKEAQLSKLTREFRKAIWDKTKDLREKYSKTQTGFKNSQEKLANRILEADQKEIKEQDLTRLYESAFSEDAKAYSTFEVPDDPYVLDNSPHLDLVDKAIVNTSTSSFAEFFKRIGATEWVKAGHKHFKDKTDGVCPYCQQKLPDDFEKSFAESFDELYEQQIKDIEELFSTYDEEAIETMARLQAAAYGETYPGIDTAEYRVKCEAVNAIVQKNQFTLMDKTNHPNQIYHVELVGDRLKELCDMLTEFYQAIETNNEVVAEQGRNRTKCIEDVFSYLYLYTKEIIDGYKKSKKVLDKEIIDLSTESDGCVNSIKDLQTEIKALGGNKVDTSEAMNSINSILRDSGMQGFHLEPHESQDNVYKVVREDGSIADNLSEGEKNFIAFLYFYYQVQSLNSPDDEKRDKIVIIDDPVSSMDSNSLFIVSTLVRNMMEVCRNNADNTDAVAEGNYIKQIFILTHNAFFHREITYNYVKRYPYVSFYLVKKYDNKSTIELCIKTNPDEPTHKMNFNPVKSSYAALWEEYNQLRKIGATVPLLNVIRKILDYYFLQLCGYDGVLLRKKILHENKGKFATDEQYTLAQSMLMYISASKISFSDGLHYVEESADPEVCCKAFETIFIIADQHQHYKMMTE